MEVSLTDIILMIVHRGTIPSLSGTDIMECREYHPIIAEKDERGGIIKKVSDGLSL
jgi:hypothetical protein